MRKEVANKYIDMAAGEARARYISTGSGQDAVYLLKAHQAREFKAAGYEGTVPMLIQAEMFVSGMNAQQATDYILATEAQWVYLASEIEKIRRAAKIHVNSLTEFDEITTYTNTIIDTLNSI